MSKFLKIFLALLLVSACSEKDNRETAEITKQDGTNVTYRVETAETIDALTTGLMNRKSLPENSGMIFDLSILGANVPTMMWMKDTFIPLDMIFIDDDGTIFWTYENTKPMSEEVIAAPHPARAVLELNAGDIKKHGLAIGDTVKFRYFDEDVVPADIEVMDIEEDIDEDADDMEELDDIEDTGEEGETIIEE